MNYKVSVSLITYNHRPYIERTLRSIVEQKTNFDFKVVVHDDASTDGTQDIIKEFAKKYPDIVFSILQNENQYSKGVPIATFTYPQFEGKYVAFCEGDDYWACDDKLQLEYDFLEQHPDYSGVCGWTDFVGENDELLLISPIPPKKYRGKEITPSLFYKGVNFGTNTLMVRAEMLNAEYIRKKSASKKVGDIILVAQAFSYGRIFAIDKLFQHHRVQTRADASNFNSIYSVAEKFQFQIDATNVIARNYPEQTEVRYKNVDIVGFYFWRLLFKGQLKEFRKVYGNVELKVRPNLWYAAIVKFPVFIQKGVSKAVTLFKAKVGW